MQMGDCVFSNVETTKALWEVTTHCPLACRHCSMSSGPKLNAFFDLDLLDTVLDQLVVRAVSKVVLSGGEPFTHPDLAAIVAGCVRADLEVSISTSGSAVRLLDFDRCVSNGLRKLTISVDGRPTTHDARRGPGTHDAMLRLLAHAIARDIEVTLNLVIGRDTCGPDLIAVAELAERSGIRSVVFCTEIDSGRGRGCRPTDSVYASLAELAIRPPPTAGLSFLVPQCNEPACPSGRTIYHVDTRGVVHDRCVYKARVRSAPAPISADLYHSLREAGS
jgi:MoaA/NifB/PqqE/SkfB family radical SAM enzyme